MFIAGNLFTAKHTDATTLVVLEQKLAIHLLLHVRSSVRALTSQGDGRGISTSVRSVVRLCRADASSSEVSQASLPFSLQQLREILREDWDEVNVKVQLMVQKVPSFAGSNTSLISENPVKRGARSHGDAQVSVILHVYI
jgi:hypothetical protein